MEVFSPDIFAVVGFYLGLFQTVRRPHRVMKISVTKSCGVNMRAVLWVLIGPAVVSSAAFAQTDEIQVYDAEIEPQGIFNLMVHSNFTPAGRTAPVFPGAIVADHSFNGTAEWAYGVTPWMEQGLYLPVYTLYSMNHTTTINGF